MILPNRFLFSATLAWLAIAAKSPAQTTLLFKDDFNVANGTSLTDPAARQPALVRPPAPRPIEMIMTGFLLMLLRV